MGLHLKDKSIGLVLSGGGVRGMAHIGAIRALEEYGISAQIVSGSSVGALVGALYANRTPIADMLSFFKETPLFRYDFFTIVKPGLVDTERYMDVFQKYFPLRFDALQRELFVVATNMQKGEEEFFHEGELLRPLLASAALPPVFSPLEINNCFYADGGIMNNFPLEPLRNKVEFVIGSNVSVIKQVAKKEINSSLQLATRTTSLMIYAINRHKISQCDLIFEPEELEKIGVLDKKSIEKAYVIGYDHAARKLEDLTVHHTSS
ncbi:patatin-like phospholipase family protein [Maribacter algicola]|uniref:Patatin-like phospholipase family protein n=1 Tax=Meishania litoralis TaxID=3434685 RepID=A0ACC7LIH4_9FLAO